MKRVLAILSAAIFLFGSVACEKEKYAEVDLSKATAPVLGSYTVNEDGVSAKYTPGSFGQSFNEKMPVNHSFAIVELDGEPASKTLATKNSDGVLSITAVNLSKALIALGKAKGSTTSLSLAVRASMQDPSRDNGINGFVDSEGLIKIPSWLVDIPEIVGSPYQDYNDASEWSVIGAISEYGINWDGDLNMWTDGNGNHVAAHVTLKAGDEVKFRKNQDWAENFGGEFSSVDAEFPVSQDGPNIVISKDGIYDLFLNLNDNVAMVATAFDPYPELTQASNWSVIGALSLNGINWDGDIAMVTDGNVHAAFSVAIAAADEFKFRQDKDWAVNLGGDFGGLDTDFAVTQDGPNIKVGADGVYDLFVTPVDGTAKVSPASGVKVSAKIGSEEPGPEPQPVTGWNIIGLNGDWNNDILATESESGIWTAMITAAPAEGEETTEFKWRKDGAWDENYGGDMVALGEPFEAVAGGNNIKIPAGFYKVVLNLNDLTITVSAGDVYALIGEINGTAWDTDFILTGADGVYTSEVVRISGGFKIRHNFSWADEDTYGAEGDVTVGTPFTAVQPGGNISVPEGNYKVQFTPATKEVLITEVGYEVPEIDLSAFTEMPEMAGAEVWAMIGPGVSDWSTDYDLQKISDDPEIWAAMNVPFKADDFKFRGNHEWAAYDLGSGAFALNTPVALVKGGNITGAFAGNFNVFLYPTYGVAYFAGEGEAPVQELPEYIYAIGGDTGWSGTYPLKGKNGNYVGFGYLSDQFKFKPNDGDNWSGDWECVGEGQLGQGSDNCPAPETPGYYMMSVNLNEMTYALTLINSIGIIGPAQAGGWDTDTDMTYNAELGCWEISDLALSAGEMKFRANDAWDINWGGAFDALTQGGDNIAVAAGTYSIKLYAWCDGKAYAEVLVAIEDTFDYSIGADYLGANNLWKAVDEAKAQRYFYSVNPNWEGQIYSGFGSDLPPYGEFIKSTYKLTFEKATTGRWQNQFFVHPDEGHFIPLEASKKYKVSITVQSTQKFDAFFKIVSYDAAKDNREGGTIWEPAGDGVPSNIFFEPNQPIKLENTISGVDAPNINIFFDLGGNPAGTVVYIKDITIIEDSGVAPAANITIDGDMSDWAEVTTGVTSDASSPVYHTFKVAADNEYIYFYSKRDNRAAIWNSGGYFYYDIDADNDSTTGVEKDGIPGLEFWMYVKPFAGSADAPAIATAFKGEAYPSTDPVKENFVFAGVNGESYVELESRLPLSVAGVKKGDTIKVYSWSNKDGYDVQKKPVEITL